MAPSAGLGAQSTTKHDERGRRVAFDCSAKLAADVSLQAVIFDFDGTLVDSFEATRIVANELAPEFGYKTCSRDEGQLLRSMTYGEIAKYLDVSMHKVPLIATRIRSRMKQQVAELPLVDGLHDVLADLSRRGLSLGILTSNSRENVEKFLSANHVDAFDFIYTASNVWGKGRRLKTLLKRRGLEAEAVAYVGDELRDIEATKPLPVRMIAVGWGYTDPSLLAAHEPSAVVMQPQELIGALE